MALNAYITATQRLLQNPPGSTALYSTADLTSYINLARGQLAGEEGCIRALASLALVGGIASYAFSLLGLGVPATTGIQGAFKVQQINAVVAGGQIALDNWAWPWFMRYYLGTTGITPARPQNWSQLGQGVSGTLYFSATPDQAYTMSCDTVCQPIQLNTDQDVEAIPYPWTDAVPYYAAYYAYMASQRQEDADRMYLRYEDFATRARKISTSGVLPQNFDQTGMNPLTIRAGGGR